jgi:aryl-alcohol dehydrogenase-like predicted oxidoreductase
MTNGIPVAMGTAAFGTSVPGSTAFELLDRFAVLGGRVLDTANNYAFWHADGIGGDSEAVIGCWLQRQNRAQFTVITKIGSQPALADKDANNLEGLSPAAVHSAVDKSLARLQSSSIDVLLAHHDDTNAPLLDTWRAFTQLVEEGTVKRVGISNYHPNRVVELARLIDEHSLAPVSAVQFKYSVIPPVAGIDFGKLVVLGDALSEALVAHAPGATVYGYGPLMGGLFEADTDRAWPAAYNSPENRERVEQIQRDAAKAGESASAWVLKCVVERGIVPVTFTSSPARLESNLRLARRLSWPGGS